MSAAGSTLVTHLESEAKKIEEYIRELVNAHRAEGVVIGLSGGVDSAVLATLAVRAAGRERVFAYYLYDKDSSKKLRTSARLVADWLGIRFEEEDITPAMRKQGVYSPLVVKITGLSGFLNRFLNGWLHRLMHKELFFTSTLRRRGPGRGRIGRFFYKRTVGAVEAAFSARHVYRRRFLEEKAGENNRLVLGAANRSEWMVGYFVKGGVDDMPFSPIAGLYKTQVLELAKYLGVPAEVREQNPSPDMMKGITDESAIGVRYEIMDVILDCIDRDMSDSEILSKGIREKDVRLVRTMKKLSAWKREPASSGSSAI